MNLIPVAPGRPRFVRTTELGHGPWTPPRRPALARPMLGAARTLTDATFDQALKAPLAVIDLSTTTCPACIAYKPVFESVASEIGDSVLMAIVYVDSSQQTAAKYGIKSVPVTVFLANGQEVDRAVGQMTREALVARIANLTQKAPVGGGAPGEELVQVPASIGTFLGLGVLGGLGYLLLG